MKTAQLREGLRTALRGGDPAAMAAAIEAALGWLDQHHPAEIDDTDPVYAAVMALFDGEPNAAAIAFQRAIDARIQGAAK